MSYISYMQIFSVHECISREVKDGHELKDVYKRTTFLASIEAVASTLSMILDRIYEIPSEWI